MNWKRLTLALLLAGCSLASAAPVDDAARMDQVVQHFVDTQQFMGAVLVARGDEIVFDTAYGHANLEWQIANTPTVKFRLGSITKQFTAVSLLLLEERGKLALGDPIKRHYPQAPPAWDAITLQHLLTHSSGIPSFTSFPEFQKLKQFPTPVADVI